MTYSNPAVRAELENWTLLKVDGDQNEDMVGFLAVPGYPSTVLYSPSGKQLQNIPGFFGPEDFLQLLQETRAALSEAR